MCEIKRVAVAFFFITVILTVSESGADIPCSTDLYQVNYEGDTLPEDDPVAPWVAGPVGNATARVENGILIIECGPGSHMGYGRDEYEIINASAYSMETRVWFSNLVIPPTQSTAAFGIRDGEKTATLFFQDGLNKRILVDLATGVRLEYLIDWEQPHVYKIEVVRHQNMVVFVDGAQVFDIQYDDLFDVAPGEVGLFVSGFFGAESISYWDYMRYSICALGGEVCDGIDNDGDGLTDEDAAGNPLAQSCYNGPSGTNGIGICMSGTQTCLSGTWGPCTGEVLPSVEVWDGSDNDCNAVVDDVPGILPEAWGVVGSGGGIVEVTNPSSPLYGAKLKVPQGALSEEASFTISLSPGLPALPSAYAAVGQRADFRCHAVVDGAEISQFPAGNEITIYLPYSQGLLTVFKTPESLVKLLRFDDGSGAWVELAGIAINRADNMAEVTSTEISAYHTAIKRPQFIKTSIAKGTCDQRDFGRVVDLVADESGKAYFTSLDSNGISFIDLSSGSWGTRYSPMPPQRVGAIAYHEGSIYFGLVTQPYMYSDQEFGICTQVEKTQIKRLGVGSSADASCIANGGSCLEFGTIVGIDVLGDGTIYIAEGHRSECEGLPGWVGSTVKKISPDFSQVTIVAGTGQNGCSDCSAPPAPALGTSVQLNFGGVASLQDDAMRQVFAVGTGVLELVEADSGALVVVADSFNQRVRILNDTAPTPDPPQFCNISLSYGQMLTVAGTGNPVPLNQSLPTGVFGAGASGDLTVLGIPASIELFGKAGITSDLANHVLWAFDNATCNITRFAGLGVDSNSDGTLWDEGGFNGESGQADLLRLNVPGGMAVAGTVEGSDCATVSSHDLLLADGLDDLNEYRRIRKIDFEVDPLPELPTPFANSNDFAWIDVFDPRGLSAPAPHTGIDFDPGSTVGSCFISNTTCPDVTSGCPEFKAVFTGVVADVQESFYTGRWNSSECTRCPIVKVEIDYWDPAFTVFYNFEPLGYCPVCHPQGDMINVRNCQRELIPLEPGDIVYGEPQLPTDPPPTIIGSLLTENDVATVHFEMQKNGEPLCPEGYFSQAALTSIMVDIGCIDGGPCQEICVTPQETCMNLGTDDDYDGDACEIADGVHVGDPCDSADADLCNDDAYGCDANNVIVCNDMPGCDDGNPCTDDSCGPTLDCVSANKADGTPCDDGNPCTENAVCFSGKCECANYVPDGTLCDDSDACTPIDECRSGSCVGLDPVVCTPLDQCHDAGTCDPSTGICSNPNKPDGASCEDGDPCSVGDTCSGGSCISGPPRDSDGDGDPDKECGGEDCDDNDPEIYFNAPEVCDGKDNDCDALTDEDLGTTTCGLGVCENTVQNCLHGVGQICIPLDLASDEVCDLLDNDCDGLVNENLTRSCSTVCGDGTETCDENGDWVDCTAPEPLMERCNGIDDDCDGLIDEGFDRDGDGYNTQKMGCGGDCNDGDASVNPGASESPNVGITCRDGVDNDCDGLTDLEDPGCQTGQPPPCVPSAEQCNGIDDDCDGQTDEDIPEVGTICNEAYEWPWPHEPICNIGTWYCSSLSHELVCISTGGGKPEKCDGIDNDCDGLVDEICRISPSSSGGFMSGSPWEPSDCAFLTDPAELSACFTCLDQLPPFYGTETCVDDLSGCIVGFSDGRGVTLGPYPVPSEYPHGTYMLAYNFSSDLETAFIYKITIMVQEEWVSRFPLAFDFIAYENDELINNPDFEQGALLSQARVERRLVGVPVPDVGTQMTFYFLPQIETRNLAIAIHGLRYYQDPDPSDGDDSGCFTALEGVTFEGGILDDHTSVFDSDGDGLADDFEISAGMDPLSAAVCDLEGLVCRSAIRNQGIENSLTSKAANACKKHEQGKDNAARNILNAFINEVGAQSGVHIPQAVADIMITFALAAYEALE